MKTKECTICKLTKDATKDYDVINGYAWRFCKSCTNEKHLKRLHKLSVEARLLRSAKSSAKRKNLELDISIDDITNKITIPNSHKVVITGGSASMLEVYYGFVKETN